MRRLNVLSAMLLGLAVCLPASARADEDMSCPVERSPPLVLPHLRQAVAKNEEVTIISMGSSSTAGFHASDIAHTYPAVLQRELERALPSSHIAVLNRGIGGQDATEELARLERDALSPAPSLVIWQVGANGAMKNADPEVFKRLVATGVKRLLAAGTDVVLMDNQRAPAILASPEHAVIEQALADIAVKAGVGLFGRGLLMDEWKRDGFPYGLFVSEDGVHHNDRGYSCIAKALASAILTGIGTDGPAKLVASNHH